MGKIHFSFKNFSVLAVQNKKLSLTVQVYFVWINCSSRNYIPDHCINSFKIFSLYIKHNLVKYSSHFPIYPFLQLIIHFSVNRCFRKLQCFLLNNFMQCACQICVLCSVVNINFWNINLFTKHYLKKEIFSSEFNKI